MARTRVLLISRTAETARRLGDVLARGGDHVDLYTDAAAAFQRVWDDDYDVIVSELGGPGIDGRDLYMALQNTWPELTRRMLFVANQPTESHRDFAVRTGVPLLPATPNAADFRRAMRTLSSPDQLM